MNILLSTLIGVGAGMAVAISYYQPNELKSDLNATNTELKSTQTALNECNLKMTGMLMNRN